MTADGEGGMTMVYVIVAVLVLVTLALIGYSRVLWRETHGWQREREQQQRRKVQH